MNSIDELVRNLLKYARRPEWETRLSDVWYEHTEETAKQFHISPDELANLIEEEGWHDALFGVVFEDFVSHRAKDEPSFAEVYLKRAGWRETPAARKYLEAMASSQLSLYEIVEVQRDRGLLLRDLLQEGPSVFVHEKNATHSLLRWDVITARVVSLLDKQVLTGGILRLHRDSADPLIESLVKPQAMAVPLVRLLSASRQLGSQMPWKDIGVHCPYCPTPTANRSCSASHFCRCAHRRMKSPHVWMPRRTGNGPATYHRSGTVRAVHLLPSNPARSNGD